MKLCSWKLCASPREARRNVLRTLGLAAPTSLMWRDEDIEWLMPGTAQTAVKEAR
jgi:hypothetical protein